jgi:5-methylcytosine-specific restriction endonuclease McrA
MPSEEAKAKQRERMRLWREANKEKRAADIKAWRARNAESIKAYAAEYRSNNEDYRAKKLAADRKRYAEVVKSSPEKLARTAENAAAWAEANPEKKAESVRRYKQRNRKAINERQRAARALLTKAEKQAVTASHREYQKQYRKANADKLKEQAAAHYVATKEDHAKWRKGHYEKNRDAYIARAEERQRKLSQRGKYTAEDVHALYVKQCGRCAGCHLEIENSRSRSAKRGFEVDHVMPVNLGGSNLPENLQLLCRPCNRKKHAKHPDEWARIAENLRIKNASCPDSKPTPNSTATTTAAPPASDPA